LMEQARGAGRSMAVAEVVASGSIRQDVGNQAHVAFRVRDSEEVLGSCQRSGQEPLRPGRFVQAGQREGRARRAVREVRHLEGRPGSEHPPAPGTGILCAREEAVAQPDRERQGAFAERGSGLEQPDDRAGVTVIDVGSGLQGGAHPRRRRARRETSTPCPTSPPTRPACQDLGLSGMVAAM
jgi:hypothetical protein